MTRELFNIALTIAVTFLAMSAREWLNPAPGPVYLVEHEHDRPPHDHPHQHPEWLDDHDWLGKLDHSLIRCEMDVEDAHARIDLLMDIK